MNKDKNSTESKYLRAYEHVKKIRGFHRHVLIYFIINIILFGIKQIPVIHVFYENRNTNQVFIDWIDVNIWGTPILWGIGLIIHGLYVYRHKFTFIKDWEKRKIQKYLDKDKDTFNDTQSWE